MKKLTLLLLLIVSTNVLSDWTEIVDNTDLTSYIDFGTIKRKGNKVKMWSLRDLKMVQKLGENDSFLSSVTHEEYDCEEETIRTLDFYFYSGNMRGGEVVTSQSNIKQEPISIPPDSYSENTFKIACGK